MLLKTKILIPASYRAKIANLKPDVSTEMKHSVVKNKKRVTNRGRGSLNAKIEKKKQDIVFIWRNETAKIFRRNNGVTAQIVEHFELRLQAISASRLLRFVPRERRHKKADASIP